MLAAELLSLLSFSTSLCSPKESPAAAPASVLASAFAPAIAKAPPGSAPSRTRQNPNEFDLVGEARSSQPCVRKKTEKSHTKSEKIGGEVGDRSLVEASAEIETRTSSSGSELLCKRRDSGGFGFGVPGFSARMFFSVFGADFARETFARE
jgi:hypothetical protein